LREQERGGEINEKERKNGKIKIKKEKRRGSKREKVTALGGGG
jgi:hypothetical protein